MVRLLLIVSAASQSAANAWMLANVDPIGGLNTFTIGLSASGTAPATSYWASGMFTNDQAAAIEAEASSAGWTVAAYDPATEPDFPQTQLQALGLQVVSTII